MGKLDMLCLNTRDLNGILEPTVRTSEQTNSNIRVKNRNERNECSLREFEFIRGVKTAESSFSGSSNLPLRLYGILGNV